MYKVFQEHLIWTKMFYLKTLLYLYKMFQEHLIWTKLFYLKSSLSMYKVFQEHLIWIKLFYLDKYFISRHLYTCVKLFILSVHHNNQNIHPSITRVMRTNYSMSYVYMQSLEQNYLSIYAWLNFC